jgi:hypothetical protein
MNRSFPRAQTILKQPRMLACIPPFAAASRDNLSIISCFRKLARSFSLILATVISLSTTGCALGRRVPAESIPTASSSVGIEAKAADGPSHEAVASDIMPAMSPSASTQQAYYAAGNGTPRPAIVSTPWPTLNSATTNSATTNSATAVSHQSGCSCHAHQSADPQRFSFHGPREFHSVYDADPACQDPRQTLVIPGLGPKYPPKPPEPSRFHPVPVRPVFDPTLSR